MPRLSKSLSKYRRKRIWSVVHAVVTLGGKHIYLGEYGSKASKTEYDRLTGEWLANGRSMPATERSITIVELIDQYWGSTVEPASMKVLANVLLSFQKSNWNQANYNDLRFHTNSKKVAGSAPNPTSLNVRKPAILV